MSSKSFSSSSKGNQKTQKMKNKEPSLVLNADGSISVVHSPPPVEEKITVGDFIFPKYKGTEYEFQIPVYHQLSSNAREVLNNLYYAHKKRDIQRCVAALKATCIIIEGESKFYCLWTGSGKGIYVSWAQMSRQIKEGTHQFAKSNSLEDALITFQQRGIKTLEEIVIPGAYQKNALEIWNSFPQKEDKEKLLKQTGVHLKLQQLEAENIKLAEQNAKLISENDKLKSNLDEIYQEAEGAAYLRFTRSEQGKLANNVGLMREELKDLHDLFVIHDRAPNKIWIQSIQEAMREDDAESAQSDKPETVPTERGDEE